MNEKEKKMKCMKKISLEIYSSIRQLTDIERNIKKDSMNKLHTGIEKEYINALIEEIKKKEKNIKNEKIKKLEEYREYILIYGELTSDYQYLL